MSAHNLMRQLDQAREAGYGTIRDPGSGGIAQISPFFGMGTLLIATTGGRTLQAAAQVPLGTRVLAFATAGSVTVNTVAVADGEYLEFVRGTDAAGDAEWEVFDPTTEEQAVAANAAAITALETLPVNAQTGTSYTLAVGDNGQIVTLSNASAITLTIPTALAAGFNCRIVQIGAGLVTLVGSGGMVINTRSASLTMHGQHSSASVNVYATDACNVEGDVSPLLEVNVQTGTSYTVAVADNGGLITLDNAGATTVDFPDGLPVGFHCKLVQLGAGLVTVTAAGSATILTESAALTLDAQHGAAEVVCYATDAYNFHTYAVA